MFGARAAITPNRWGCFLAQDGIDLVSPKRTPFHYSASILNSFTGARTFSIDGIAMTRPPSELSLYQRVSLFVSLHTLNELRPHPEPNLLGVDVTCRLVVETTMALTATEFGHWLSLPSWSRQWSLTVSPFYVISFNNSETVLRQRNEALCLSLKRFAYARLTQTKSKMLSIKVVRADWLWNVSWHNDGGQEGRQPVAHSSELLRNREYWSYPQRWHIRKI